MTVHELSREQMAELKGRYLYEKNEEKGEGTSWGELFNADNTISDEEMFEEYSGTNFVPDDFSCTTGKKEPNEYFDTVEDCLNSLAEEGIFTSGDSIKFIGACGNDDNDIEEIRVYDSCNCVLSTYRIRL